MNAETAEAPVLLDPGDSLTIFTAEAWCRKCHEAIRPGARFIVPLARVTACDTLGIQLLCALERSAAGAGSRVAFDRPSEAVLRAAEAIGCTALILSHSLSPA